MTQHQCYRQAKMWEKIKTYAKVIGPGIAIAATGVGAGDLVAAAVAGSRYGLAVAWAAALGALLKFSLNEGLARWQLATGTTLLEGWVRYLGKWVKYVFLVYLVLWSFIVGGALVSACGLAGHTIFPSISVAVWGVLHSIAGIVFVLLGRYAHFESLMKLLIGLMFVLLVGCALFVSPPIQTVGELVKQASVPLGSAKFLLGVIGGVGGSLTLLVYGYWIREKGWSGKGRLTAVRVDLGVAYVLTGLFGVAVMVLADKVLFSQGIKVQGTSGVIQMATTLESFLGRAGYWTFVFGFWGAVATSLLGVWQSVPYLFCDFVGLMKNLPKEQHREILQTNSKWYRGYLLYLGIFPLSLLFVDKPIVVIVAYSIVGAFFMPFLVITLLYMNSNREWVGELKNRWYDTVLLVITLIVFGYLCFNGLSELATKFL